MKPVVAERRVSRGRTLPARLRIDGDADVAYLKIGKRSRQKSKGRVVRSLVWNSPLKDEDGGCDLILDVDAFGAIVGIEFLQARFLERR